MDNRNIQNFKKPLKNIGIVFLIKRLSIAPKDHVCPLFSNHHYRCV
ncbi:MAG: hypothetical protein ACO34H_02830 [Candidatus Puniceispirillaceae bacterium]